MKKTVLVLLLLSAALPPSSTAVRDEWNFQITPYWWFVSSEGNLTVDGTTVPFDLSYSDIAEKWDSGILNRCEAWRGDLGFFIDGIFANLEDDSTVSDLKYETKSTVIIADLGTGYRIAELPLGSGSDLPLLTIELLGGGRYMYFKGETDISGGSDTSRSQYWFEPFVGGRLSLRLAEKWYFSVRGDAGGFGIGSASDLTWSLVLAINYRVTKHIGVALAYRILDIDYSRGSGDDKSALDSRLQGPGLGVSLWF